jgi:hypothetical protein
MRSKLTLAFIFALMLTSLVAGPSLAAESVANSRPGPATAPDVTPAHAGTFLNMGNRSGAGIHECASSTCRVIAWAKLGDALFDYCYVNGQELEPGAPYWDYVVDVKTSAAGYIHENWLWDKSQARHC